MNNCWVNVYSVTFGESEEGATHSVSLGYATKKLALDALDLPKAKKIFNRYLGTVQINLYVTSERAAMATFLGVEESDLSKYHYKPGRHTGAVYLFKDAYYCISKNRSKLPMPIHAGMVAYQWIEVEHEQLNTIGWMIFSGSESRVKSRISNIHKP